MTPEDLSRHELRSLLARWGDWMERHDLDASLPHQSAFMLLYADQPAGHKILCAEMTKAVWMVNYYIEKLPSSIQDALLIGYALNVKTTGGYWTLEEKAKKLRVSTQTLRIRISRAVGALHRKIFPLTDRKNSAKQPLACVTVTEAL